jgi:hypothetical protein
MPRNALRVPRSHQGGRSDRLSIATSSTDFARRKAQMVMFSGPAKRFHPLARIGDSLACEPNRDALFHRHTYFAMMKLREPKSR